MFRLALAGALFCAASVSARGQSVATNEAPAAKPSCVESIPDAALTRVPVFAMLYMVGATERPVPPAAENMLQAVVDRVETMLGATPGSLPKGEPAIRWDGIERGLRVTWHRDGRVAARIRDDVDPARPSEAKAATLFASAFDSARAAGELFMPWPDDDPRDSVVMGVYFRRPIIDEAGTLRPIDERVAVPMFTVAAPREKPVSLTRRPPKPHYPEELLVSGLEGKVTLQFVVDTTGVVDTLTFRDLWPEGEPRLEGRQAEYYQQLVATAKATVRHARFSPAEMGGCKVRQLVQQPFTWLIR